MQAYIGITDYEWYQLLGSRPQLDELNFWQPGGNRIFRALQPGELFLFKLHAPRHSLVGGGFFAHATRLPVSLAWAAFGEANGATSRPASSGATAATRARASARSISRSAVHRGCIAAGYAGRGAAPA